jgi:hypothetical protein
MLEQPMRKVEEVAEVVTVEAEDLVIEEVVIEEVVVVEVTISGNNLFRKSEFLFWFSKGFIKKIFFRKYLNFNFLLIGIKKKSCTFAQLFKKQYQIVGFLDQ